MKVSDLDDYVRSSKKSFEAAFVELDERSNDALYSELSWRVAVTAAAPAEVTGFTPTVDADDVPRSSASAGLGARIFRRWSAALHEFLCSSSADDEAMRARVFQLISKKDGTAPTAVACVLVGSFGVSPAVAAVVSVLCFRIVFRPAGAEICAQWRKSLAPTSGLSRKQSTKTTAPKSKKSAKAGA